MTQTERDLKSELDALDTAYGDQTSAADATWPDNGLSQGTSEAVKSLGVEDAIAAAAQEHANAQKQEEEQALVDNAREAIRIEAQPGINPVGPKPDRGVFGDSWGVLAPDERAAAAKDEYDFATGVAKRTGEAAKFFNEPSQSVMDAVLKYNPVGLIQGAITRGLDASQQKRAKAATDVMEGRAPLPELTPTRAFVENTVRGAAQAFVVDTIQSLGIARGYATKISGGKYLEQADNLKVDPSDDPLYKIGINVEEWVKKQFPGDGARQQQFAQQLAQGVGSTIGFAGTGWLGQLAGAGERGTLALIGLTGAASQSAQTFKEVTDALKRGDATETDRTINMLAAIALGATEAAPFAPTIGAGMRGVGPRMASAIEQTVEESLQEGVQQAGQNLVTQQTYDPNQTLLEGVPEGMAIGGLTGAAFGGALGGHANVAVQGAQPPQQEARLRTQGVATDAGPTAPAPDTRPVAPMMDGPGQSGSAKTRTERPVFSDPDLEAARKAIQDAAQGLPVETVPTPEPAEEAAPAATGTQAEPQSAQPDQPDTAPDQAAPEDNQPLTDEQLDLPAVFADIEQYLSENEIDAEMLDENVRKVAEAVYNGEDLGTAIDRALGVGESESGTSQADRQRRLDARAAATDSSPLDASQISSDFRERAAAKFATMPAQDRDTSTETPEEARARRLANRAAATDSSAISSPAGIRQKFAEVLASPTPRSQWAEATGVSPETLQTLIDEAVADGRMEIRFGKPVRKAAARVAPVKPQRTPAQMAAAQSAPAMLRSEEKRLDAIKSDKAYAAAADLFNARGTPQSFQAALDRLYSDKALKNADLAQITKAFTGKRTKPKNRQAAIDMLAQSHKAWAARNSKGKPTDAANRTDMGQGPGSVPEGRVSEGVRADAEGRDAGTPPEGDRAGRAGDVGGQQGGNDDGTGLADGVRGPGEAARADTGDRAGTGQPRPDTSAAGEPAAEAAPAKPRERTPEEIAALEADLKAEQEELEAQRRDRTTRNYRITDADRIGQGGPKQKVRANIAAIETLKKIEEENRPATDEEKAILVKYVGWGAFSQPIFLDYNQEFAKERAQIKALLTPEEYKSARASTINAHFTSPEVIKGMWLALEHLGFKGGRVLEPSVGIGHFIGLQPEHLSGNSDWTAVDLDVLSGRITRALYGAADVRIGGFEEQTWPNDHFDLAISNVPFDANGPYDPAYKQKFTLHDYFFVKSLDKVRPGGLVAFVTSAGTLDKTRDSARREMEKRGTFLGAIRLPGGNKGAFKANAGTDVTTDIIFFRKRMQGESADINPEWTSLETVKTPEGDTDINGYFVKNPDMMLGKMRLIGSMYGKGEPVLIGPTDNLDERITQAAKTLPENAMTDRSTVVAPADDVDTATDGIKEGAFYLKDGKIYRKVVGVGQPQKLNKQDAGRVQAFIPIRDTINEMLAKQASGNKTGMEDLRAALSASYDAFVAQFGPINLTNVSTQTRKNGKIVTVKRMPNFAVLEDDVDAYKVAAIESYDVKTGKATKTAIFTEDLLKPYERPAVTGPADALTVSLNEAGRVDMKLIAQVLGVSEKRAAQELGDAVFLNPAGEQWQTASQYLSGDVVTKLADAKAAADLDPKYARNVAALEAVQPVPLTRNEITIPLGATYVPEDVINAFLDETLEARGVQASLNPATKAWSVRFLGGLSDAARAQWATPDNKVGEIVEAALNSKPIMVWRTVDETRVRDPKAEELARAKVTMLKEAFTGQIYPGAQAAVGGWVWNDEARATRLEALYNQAMNRLVKEQHDGSHLTFPGLARVVSFPDGTTGKINLPPARTGAIWRIIQNGNTLIDHVVGAGKTWTSIMAVQEMKRLGQIRRPMFVVPNHMLMQFSAEFLQAYPGAKLLVATKDNMTRAKRAEFAAKAAAEKWDGIIITHSAFSRLRMQDKAYQDYYEEILEQMESAKKGEDDATVKDIVKAQKRIKTKLDNLIKKENKDQGVTFEELGVDHITVDEAHLFKNLWFMTRHTRVKGISNSSESQRATDLYIKIRHLEKSRPGRSALFLTGTPLSNTMAEVYTMMRYLQRPTMEEWGISEFDSWAQTFGMIDTKTELASNAKDYTDITSFSKFVNIPELSTLYGRIADTQTAESLGLERPAIKGGAPQVIMSEPSEQERSLLDAIIKKMEELKGKKPEKGDPNFLSMFTKGLQASTDARLVDPAADYNPDGKIGKAVGNIYRIWEEGNKDPAAPNKAQIVFLDMGVPGSRAKAKPVSLDMALADENAIDTNPLEAVRKGLADTEAEQSDEADDAEEMQPEKSEDDAAVEKMLYGKFNLYEDMKNRLIEKGVPADQIAFIHDAKNDDQKAKLFEAVREGKVRVLIGSTGKMGVGTNVQKRLIALHHIDAPWRPSDLEQRDGRILRQGNKNPEIQIYRYITTKSFEAYRWQILERKASFIAQFRAGARGLRIAEDIDSPLPDASEIKAAATGDSRIIEYADLDRTVRGLIAQASAHSGVAVRARQALGAVKSSIAAISKRIGTLEADAAKVVDLKGDSFKITVNLPGGQTQDVTERKKAGQALGRYIASLAQNAYYGREIDIEFGEISGFGIAGTVKKGPDGIEVRPEITGNDTYRAKSAFFFTEETNPVTLIQHYERLVSGVKDLLADAQMRLAQEEAQIPGLEAKTVSTPFPKQAELEEKQKRLVELGEALKPKKEAERGSPEDMSRREVAARERMAQPDYATASDMESGFDTSKVPGFWSENWKADRRYTLPDGSQIGFEGAIQYLFDQAVKKAENSGGARKDRKAFLVIGFGGAGKSTLANPLAKERGAVHASADDAKLIIPEFDGGKNSGGVHEESSEIGKVVLRRLIDSGYNIVLEKLGSNAESIGRPMERAIARFEAEGRAISVSTYDLQIDDVFATSSAKGDVGYGTFEWQEPSGWRWGEVNAPDLDGLVITDRFTGKPIRIGGDSTAGVDALGRSGGRQVLDTDGNRASEGTAGQGRRLVPPSGADADGWLRQTLLSYGIDPGLFGSGEAKPFSNLVKEVTKGEAELVDRDGKLIRLVRPLALDIFADVDGKRVRLVEDRQVFSDGRERRRGLAQSIGEKLEPGESPQESIARALEEELGITKFEQISGIETSTTSSESPSYPGLMSEYTTYKTSVLIDPSEYKSEYQEKQKDKTNYFLWQPANASETSITDASLSGDHLFAEAEMPADAGTAARILELPQRLRDYTRDLFRAGLDKAALDGAISQIGSDQRLIAKDWLTIAEAYTGGPVDGKSAAAAADAIRREFASRIHDVSLAERGGFDPAVSGSNLAFADETRNALETLSKRLPEGVPIVVKDVIQIATRSASIRDLGLEVEGGLFSPEQAQQQLGVSSGTAKKIMAVSLAYGPDVALQTFTHEEIHALRALGLFSDKEWSILAKLSVRKPKKSEALRLVDLVERSGKISADTADSLRIKAGDVTYREIYAIDQRYGRLNLPEDKLIEEVVAHVAADWADGHDFGNRVERLMMKIRDLIEAIGNFLRGNGFETVDSIFNSVWSGEVAKMANARETQTLEPPVTGYPIVASTYRGVSDARHFIPDNGRPMWASSSVDISNEYADTRDGVFWYNNLPKDMQEIFIEDLGGMASGRLEMNFKNPLVVDARGSLWKFILFEGKTYSSDELAELAKQRGHDGLVVKNVIDSPVDDETERKTTSYAALKSGTVKSAYSKDIVYSIAGQAQDAETGRSMRRDLDELGYYSQALEAAKALKQSKGTPEQMLAQLKSAGVKQAEIEATKLGVFLEGKKSVSKDDIVDYLAKRRVHLLETEYVRHREKEAQWELNLPSILNPSGRNLVFKTAEEAKAYADDVMATYEPQSQGLLRKKKSVKVLPEWQHDVDIPGNDGARYWGVAKSGPFEARIFLRKSVESTSQYERYSLDRNNPTYRETILHLPEIGNIPEHVANTAGDWGSTEPDDPLMRNHEFGSVRDPNFRKGHFPQANIIGHMMTSLVKDDAGRDVYLVDQIQSDWGQKLRDGGARDEVKVAELESAIKEAAREAEATRAAIESSVGEDLSNFVSIHALRYTPFRGGGAGHQTVPASDLNGLFHIMERINQNLREFPQEAVAQARVLYRRGSEAKKTLESLTQNMVRLKAELRVASASSPANPLVNTTDQWVNTTLRRAIRQAAEAGADSIAIPSGKTVLSYNPGDEEGMSGFYDKIVPKNLKNLLAKLDPKTPAPVRVDQLITPTQGPRGKGFILIKLTDKAKATALYEGMPMFSLAGGRNNDGPIKAWHSTPAQFDKFDDKFTDEVGFHFGSKSQAHNRAYIMSNGNLWKYFRNWRDIPVEMDIRNPVRLSADPGSFMPTSLAQQLVKDGIAPYGIIAQVQDAQLGHLGSPERAKEIVRQYLIGKGYDAIAYPNAFEDKGGTSYMTLGTGNVRHAVTGDVLYSLAGGEEDNTTASLNEAIDSLKSALGIQVTQNLFGVTIKVGNRSVRINPRSNILGQTSRATGGVGVRRSRDIRAIAHEGGHSLELMLGDSLDAIKAKYADSLVAPFAPDLPMPKMAPSGFSGLELDNVEQQALVDAVKANDDLLRMSAVVGNAKSAPRIIGKPQYDEALYRKSEVAAGLARAKLIRLIGKTRADALMDEVRTRAPASPTQFVQERFSPMGAPKRRATATPDGEALSEAFARWFEKYVMARDAAYDMAADFFDAFEDLLEAESPTVLEGLHTVQQQYKDWTKRATVEEMSSDVVSVASQNDWNAIAEGKRTFKDTVTGWAADAYTGVIDDLSPVQMIVRRLLTLADKNGVKDDQGRPISLKVSENPYKIARMFRGSYATGYSWIQDGIPNHGEERVAYPGLQRSLETVFGGARWDEKTYKAFGQYLISKRAIAEYDRLANKKQRLADIDGILQQGSNVWRNLTNEQAKDSDKLDRRNVRLTQLTAIRDDRTNALRRAKTEEKAIQKRMQTLRDELAEALAAVDDGSDVYKTVRDRKRRSLQIAERNARESRNLVVDLEQELQDIDMEWTLLGNEIVNLRAKTENRQPQIDAVESSVNLLKKERDTTAKRGASRPPTLESREWHQAFVSKVDNDKKYARFAEASKGVYAFTQGLLTVRYQAGLISADLYRELSSRKGWYVPFMRDMTDAAPESVFTGNGGGKTWSPFKKFDGSDRSIINPLEILSQEAYAAAQHIAMNEAVGALATLAQKAGTGSAQIAELLERTEDMENTPDTWNRIRDIAISMGIDEADATIMAQRMEMNFANDDLQAIWSPSVTGPMAEPSLPLWENGVRKHVVLRDKEFGHDALQAMLGLGKEQMNWLLEAFGVPARALQVGVTTHPTFMPRNLVRDIFDAWIKTGAVPVATQIRGARALVEKDGEFLRQYTAAGGILGGRNIAALTSKEQQADVLDMDPNKTRHGSSALGALALGLTGTVMAGPLGGLAGSIIGYAGARHGGLLKMVEAVESMTRLGVAAHAYKRALEHNPNLTEQEAMLEAAFVARDVFDWNRRGSKSLALVRTITFLNAQIQGLDRAARAIGGAGDRGSVVAKHLRTVFRREHAIPLSADETRELGEAYKVFARMALYTALLLGLYAMYHDDDRYDDIKQGTKATHSWLPGFLGVDIRLPKAFEWAMPANFIEVLWDKMSGRNPDFGERMKKSVQEVIVPPGVPQGLNLLVGWTTNTDMQSIAPWMFGDSADKVNRKIVSDELKKLAPEQQFDAFTSQLSKDIAVAMAKAGVPEDAIPSPKMIDFTMRTGGYWGTDIQKAYQFTKEGLGFPAGPQPRVPDMPLIGGFTGIAARQSRSLEELYNLMSQQGGEFTTAAATYKNMLDKAGDPAGAEAFLNRLDPEARAYAILSYNFTAADKRRHPLERASAMAKITRDIRKEVVLDRLAPPKKEGRKSVYDFDNKIDLPPPVKTQVQDIMERLAQAESWNGFVALGRPGWAGKSEMATKPILDELKAAAPDVYRLFTERVDKAKIEDYETVKKEWPKMREELLRNGADAAF